MLSNKKSKLIVTELLIRSRKLNIFFAFITQLCFKVHKGVTLNTIMKSPNKGELQQIAYNHSSYIDFKDFMILHKKCTAKPYAFLVIDATLESVNFSRFRKNLLKII